ncbi:unnamed protein product [Closterium sp. Yama58-4]|nr:unnamed protein product [Closterium sp. Yama58-4]
MTDIDWPEDPQNDAFKETANMCASSDSGSKPSASALGAKIQIPEPKSVRKDRRVSAAWNEAFFNKNAESLLDLDDDEDQLAPDLPPVDLSFLPMFTAPLSGDATANESGNTPKDDRDPTCSESGGTAEHQRMTSEQKVAAIIEKSSTSDCAEVSKSATRGGLDQGPSSTRLKLPGAAPRFHSSNAKTANGAGASPAPGAKTPAASSRTPKSAMTTAPGTGRQQSVGASASRLAKQGSGGCAVGGVGSCSLSKHGGSTASHAGTAERSKRASATSSSSSHSRQAASCGVPSKGGAGASACAARVDLHSRFESSTDVEDSTDAGQSRRPEEEESLNEAQSHAVSVSGEEESVITAQRDMRDHYVVRFEEASAASGAEKPAGNVLLRASESEIVAKSEDAPAGALRGMVGRGSKAMRACAPSPMKPAAAREPLPVQASAAGTHRGSSGSASSARSSNDTKQQQLREWQQQRQLAVAAKSRPSASATAGGPPRAAVRAGANIGGKPGVGPGAVAARAGVPKSTSHCTSTSLVPAGRSLVHGGASSGVGGSGLDVLRTSSTRSTGTSTDAGKRVGFVGVGSGHGAAHGKGSVAAAAGFAFSAAANSTTAKVATAVARTVFSAKPRTLSKDSKAVSTEGSAGASQGSTSGAVGAPSAAGASSASGLFGLKFTAGKADDRAAVKKGAPAATSRRVSGVGARKARFGFGLGGKAAPTAKEKEEEAKEKAGCGSTSQALAVGQGGAKRVAADSKVASGKQMVVSKGGALAKEKAPGASTSPLAAALKVAANHSKLLGLASRIPVPKTTGRFGFGGSSSNAKAGAGKESEKAAGRGVHGSGLGGKVEATHGRAGQQKTQQAHAGPSQTKIEAVTPRASRESNASHRSSSSQHSNTVHATNTPRASNTPHTSSTLRASSSAQKKPSPRVEKKAGSGTHWVPGGVAQPSALAAADAAFSAMSTPRSSDAGQQLSRERAGEKHTGNDGQEEQQQQDEEKRQSVHPGGVLTVAMGTLAEQGECADEKDVGGEFGTVQGGGEGGENAADEGHKMPGGKSGSESEKGRKGLSLKAIGAFVAGGSPWKKSARKVAAEREREEMEEAGNEQKERSGSVVCTPQKAPGRAGQVEEGERGASIETVEKEGERGAWASTEKVGEWVGEVLETAGTPDGSEQLKTDLFKSNLAKKDLFKGAFPKPDFPQAPLTSAIEQPSEAAQNQKQKQPVSSSSLQSAASSSEAGMYTAPASPEAEEEGKDGQEGDSRSILSQKGDGTSRGRSLGASGRGMFTAPASPEAEVEGGGEMKEEEEEAGEVTPPGSGEKQGGGAERAEAAVGAQGEDLDPFMRKVLEAEALGVVSAGSGEAEALRVLSLLLVAGCVFLQVALEKKGGRVLNSPLMTKQPLPPRNPWSPVRKAEVGPYDCTKRSLAASLDSFSLPASSSGASNFSVTGRIGSGSSTGGFPGMGNAGMRMSYGH